MFYPSRWPIYHPQVRTPRKRDEVSGRFVSDDDVPYGFEGDGLVASDADYGGVSEGEY